MLNINEKIKYILRCIHCGSNIDWYTMEAHQSCVDCGNKYYAKEWYLRTEFDKALFEKYKKDYLLNKALNNNGYISYKFLSQESLSFADRNDVCRFRSFIEKHLTGDVILDVGCGPLPLPGYLALKKIDKYAVIGLDPLDSNIFNGFRIVGVSEFIPVQNSKIDTIVFATSLDHVCNIKRSIQESRRIINENGRVVVWMSDKTILQRIKILKWIKSRVNSFKCGYPVDKYWVYPNWTVLEVPKGGVDPFHSYSESPKSIIKEFMRSGFILLDREENSKDEVFLSFGAN